jgi:G:T/U-mismatch repair DNA glycosylase
MIEDHPFVYFLPQTTERLIIGSFPCFNGTDHGEWFYAGSGKNEFWRLLAAVFNQPTESKADKQILCEQHGIALTDIALRIERKENNCSDANLHIIEINRIGLDICLAAWPNMIYFTSKFVQRHFFRHYPEVSIPSQVLVSPSPAANRHIASLAEYKQMRAKDMVKSPYEYRQLKYRQMLLAEDPPRVP